MFVAYRDPQAFNTSSGPCLLRGAPPPLQDALPVEKKEKSRRNRILINMIGEIQRRRKVLRRSEFVHKRGSVASPAGGTLVFSAADLSRKNGRNNKPTARGSSLLSTHWEGECHPGSDAFSRLTSRRGSTPSGAETRSRSIDQRGLPWR